MNCLESNFISELYEEQMYTNISHWNCSNKKQITIQKTVEWTLLVSLVAASYSFVIIHELKPSCSHSK